MKKLIQLNLLLLLISSATAQESQPQETSPQQPPKILHAYDWKDLNVQSPNTNCQIKIISMDGMSVLKIENTNNAPLEVLLLTVENSALIQRANRIEWEMKYENVVGTYGAATRELFEKFHPRALAATISPTIKAPTLVARRIGTHIISKFAPRGMIMKLGLMS